MLWHIGNTTVRTPYRLRTALKVLHSSPLNGNISGREQENAFASLLHHEGVLDAPRVTRGEDASDLGRKWRVALSQLGFITPQLTRGTASGSIDAQLEPITNAIDELSGRPYEVTPNGLRLANAEIITAQQECFLRSLASYRIPSAIETNYQGNPFSPLRHILRIISGLSAAGHEPVLSFHEFSLFVQTSSPEDGMDNIVDTIIQYRTGRQEAAGNVRAYDRGFYEQKAQEVNREQATLSDYADLTFRYVKATGLFRNAGRGIGLNPSREALSDLLLEQELPEQTDAEYLSSLWLGAQLPTDDAVSARAVVQNLTQQANDRGIAANLPAANTPLPELEAIRHELEDQLSKLDERDYAQTQPASLDEILAWFDAIPTRGSVTLPNGDTVSIPKGEGPAYLEWIVWRAFLAINSLSNEPWEARRFQIDQDFLPVHCAPGGGPDMIFEFDNCVIVVEVTLTSSSRQEAAEGEPVRRHVAQHSTEYNKPVYGLFIAVSIDSNTANTFRLGDWYQKDDTKLALDIVPMTLADFRSFVASGRDRFDQMPNLLRQLLIECRARANQDAPQWKTSISEIVGRASAV
jgi:hypothetical protein